MAAHKSNPRVNKRIGRTSSRRLRSTSDTGRVLEEEDGDYQEQEQEEQEEQEEQVEDESEGGERGGKKFSCPFSQGREGATNLCGWAAHVDKRSVRLPFLSNDSH